MKRGLSGFRLHPLYYQNPSWVDAQANDALWDAAAETGAILQFHMRPEHAAAAVGRMKERHPGVRVVIDHLGKPDVLEPAPYPSYQAVLRLAQLPDVWVKIGDYQIASRQSFPWHDTWPFVTLLKEAFGPDRMLWGTGYAGSARLVPIEQALEYVEEQLPLTEGERRTILWDAPARLFGFTR
jgi:predicted TIM-barrel fold metal-dependent hydrolase